MLKHSALTEISSSSPYPYGPGSSAEQDVERLLEPEVVGEYKEMISSGQSRAVAHMNLLGS